MLSWSITILKMEKNVKPNENGNSKLVIPCDEQPHEIRWVWIFVCYYTHIVINFKSLQIRAQTCSSASEDIFTYHLHLFESRRIRIWWYYKDGKNDQFYKWRIFTALILLFLFSFPTVGRWNVLNVFMAPNQLSAAWPTWNRTNREG